MVNKKRKFGLKEIVLGLTLAIATPMVFGCGSVRKGGLIDTIMTKSSKLPGDKFLYDHGIIPRALTVPSVQERLDKERGIGKDEYSYRKNGRVYELSEKEKYEKPWRVVKIRRLENSQIVAEIIVNKIDKDRLVLGNGENKWPDHIEYIRKHCNDNNSKVKGYRVSRYTSSNKLGIGIDNHYIEGFNIKCSDLEQNAKADYTPQKKGTIIEENLTK